MDKVKIVCLGDSITYGFPFTPQDSWVQMLAEETGLEFINKGVPGNTFGNMLERINRDVLRKEPSHLILMGGINDVFARESLSRIYKNILDIVNKAQENNIQVILGLPTAIDYEEEERTLKKLRNWMKDYARDNNLKCIEFQQAFYNEKDELRSELLLADGGHPSKKGYQEMFKQIPKNLFNE